MSITTYAELQTAIGDFLNRDDLTSVIPSFIDLAESQMQRDIHHWRREARDTVSASSQYTTLPNDFFRPIRVILQSKYRALDVMSGNEMADARYRRADSTGEPCNFAITAGELELLPTPDDTYTVEIVYETRIEALSDANTSNWVLTYAPDVYLYGALVHSAPYLDEDSRSSTWAAFYQAAVQALNNEGQSAKFGGSLRIRSR